MHRGKQSRAAAPPHAPGCPPTAAPPTPAPSPAPGSRSSSAGFLCRSPSGEQVGGLPTSGDFPGTLQGRPVGEHPLGPDPRLRPSLLRTKANNYCSAEERPSKPPRFAGLWLLKLNIRPVHSLLHSFIRYSLTVYRPGVLKCKAKFLLQ